MFATHGSAIGKCPFYSVNTIMILKVGAQYENESACIGLIKLECDYARLNIEFNTLDAERRELERENNTMVTSAGVLSSSSDDPDWREMGDRIVQIAIHRSQMITELRSGYDLFKRLQDTIKPKYIQQKRIRVDCEPDARKTKGEKRANI